MTDFNKIKNMVDNYEIHLGYINAMFEHEGNTSKLQKEGADLDKEFSAIVEEVAIPFHNLIRGYANAGIEIRDIDVVDGGRTEEPHHTIFIKIGAFTKNIHGWMCK